MMARRLLYFPLLVNEIKRHFGSISRTLISETNNISFSNSEASRESVSLSIQSQQSQTQQTVQCAQSTQYAFTCKVNEKDLILPLHLPIGLLYDLVSSFKDESALPWKLEFHIFSSSSPSPSTSNDSNLLNQVINFPDEQQFSSFYFSNLKEADHLRSGSARNVMNLSRSEQLQLWESVKGSEFERFWRINQKLIVNGGSSRSIPIKFWICDRANFKITKLQFPIPPAAANQTTLKDLLISEFSEQFVNENLSLSSVCLHGIRVPLTIHLDELNYNWNYSDNFINILLLLK